MTKFEDAYEKALAAAKTKPVRPGTDNIRNVIGDRIFSDVAWTIEYVTRPNGTGYWQLTEMAGKGRTDYPVLYHTGEIAYDFPERLPRKVIQWANSQIRKFGRE